MYTASSHIQTLLSVLELHQISRMTIMYTIYYMFANQVADYTAGRELHPAPKIDLVEYFIMYSIEYFLTFV